MKASEVNLNRFLASTDTQFIIPVYQRNYDWTIAQCKQLMDDILAVGSNEKQASHFIGSIVYIHDDVYSVSGVRELSIIDGQQRLTTVTLIYITLFVLAKESGNEQLVNRIQETYLINKFAKEEEKLKLRPTENNDKALKYLLRNDNDDEYNEYSRLIENYNYFKTRVNNINMEEIQRGLSKLLFVEISLERDKDDPQKIFESLNSTGLELTQSDLIRNYILMGLKNKDQIYVYDTYWRLIEINATHEDSNTNRVSDFIRDFLTIENREIPNKGKVYQEFKNRYPLTDLQSLEKILSKIKRFSIFYNKFLNPNNENDLDIRLQLHYFNKLEVNVAYPFLLEVYSDYSSGVISKDTLIEVFELVQSFAWRRFIVGLPTNALNKIFMRLYEDIDHSNYLTSLERALLLKKSSQRFPGDKDVLGTLRERDMYGIQTKNRSYFFDRLENYQNRELVGIDGNPEITVEHIFPQNPDSKWMDELGEEQYNLIMDRYLNTISNLTLSGNNGKLGNKSFVEKRDMNIDGKEQGYKFSRLWLNKHLSTLDKWNVTELESRFEIIAERFLKIWPYPSVSIASVSEFEEVNIFDAEDPTHKKLDYAIFFDQKLEVRTVTELYYTVLRQLFELSPQTFFTPEIETKLTLTKHKDECGEPFALNDTYFIELKLGSKVKFDKLKFVLNTLDLADELFIRYASE